MSDAVKLELIRMVGTLITTIGVTVGLYLRLRKTARATHDDVRETKAVVTATSRTVSAIDEQTNGRLTEAMATIAALTAERDRLLAEAASRRRDDP